MKPDSAPPESWEKLVAARRAAVAPTAARDEAAPYGFAQRIAARAMALQPHRHLTWWTRWSLRMAGVTTLVAALVALVPAPETTAPPLLAAPLLEIPLLAPL